MIFIRKIIYVISLTVMLFLPAELPAKDELKFSKDIRQEAGRWGFKIKYSAELPNGLTGRMVPPEQAEGELQRFFSALDDLGVKFVKKSGLKNVLIVKDLSRHGKRLSGNASNDTIYLKYGFRKRTVYHEMFHVFDNKRDDKFWQRLNHKDFRYLGISYPNRPLPEKNKKDLAKHYRKTKRSFDADFASNYAKSNEREDRAETFTAMVEDGSRFAARAAQSPVLYKKMQYIIDMTGKRSLMDDEYWKSKLGSKAFRKK